MNPPKVFVSQVSKDNDLALEIRRLDAHGLTAWSRNISVIGSSGDA